VTETTTDAAAQLSTEVTGTTPETPEAATPDQPRGRSAPTSALAREHAEAAGRRLFAAFGTLGGLMVQLARGAARLGRRSMSAAAAIPPTLQAFGLSGLGLLIGIVGALAWHGSAGLFCIVVVIPISSMVLGGVGHRFYAAPRQPAAAGPQRSASHGVTPSDHRALEYVDQKLTFALRAFGAQRNQHAMVALFQAKTAIELALGTEQDSDIFSALDDHPTRPRIRAGSASKTLFPESNSLAAS